MAYLEKDLTARKEEHEDERRQLKDQVMELTTEGLQAKSGLKVLEEKHRLLENEKTKLEV